MEVNRNYKLDLEINSSNLEDEWIEQPSLYMYYSDLQARAIKERDDLKQKLDVHQAQLDSKVRKNWEQYFEKSPTESAIKNYIVLNVETKKLVEKLNELSYNVSIMTAAKTAFEHRKKALENLVTLLITGFHSEPKLKNEATRRTRHFGLKKNK